eukprot:1116321-Rhodomonas_salina.2
MEKERRRRRKRGAPRHLQSAREPRSLILLWLRSRPRVNTTTPNANKSAQPPHTNANTSAPRTRGTDPPRETSADRAATQESLRTEREQVRDLLVVEDVLVEDECGEGLGARELLGKALRVRKLHPEDRALVLHPDVARAEGDAQAVEVWERVE